MGYGDGDYQLTIRHLRKRGDEHCDVWREGADGWKRVTLRKDSA
jgi:hypothetical protein